MNQHFDQQNRELSASEARQATTEHRIWRILAISLIVAAVGLFTAAALVA